MDVTLKQYIEEHNSGTKTASENRAINILSDKDIAYSIIEKAFTEDYDVNVIDIRAYKKEYNNARASTVVNITYEFDPLNYDDLKVSHREAYKQIIKILEQFDIISDEVHVQINYKRIHITIHDPVINITISNDEGFDEWV